MIARDDVVVTFHKGDASLNLKIAVRSGSRSAPEILDLLKAVVADDINVSYVIQTSRFSPTIRSRMRERVTSFFDPNHFGSPVTASANSNKDGADKSANPNVVNTPKTRGRPRQNWPVSNGNKG